MKKVKFKKDILNEYLKFFNCSLDNLISKISTEKTKDEKRKDIRKGLEDGEVEFRILKKISEEFKINVYNFFLSEFNESKEDTKTIKLNIPSPSKCCQVECFELEGNVNILLN